MIKNFRNLLPLLAFVATFTTLRAQTPDDRLGTFMPNFAFPEVGGGNVTMYHLKAGTPLVVFYFDPDCEHCQLEASQINEQIAKFKDVNLLFVAFHDPENIKAFRDKYFPGVKRDHMFFCADPKYQFDKTFGYSQAPTIHVYSKDWKKIKVFRNEVAPEEILKLLE
jgi:peroxiredoxin